MEDENRKQVRGDMQRKLLTSISDVISVPIVFYQFSSQKIFRRRLLSALYLLVLIFPIFYLTDAIFWSRKHAEERSIFVKICLSFTLLLV